LDSQVDSQVQIHKLKKDNAEKNFQSATVKGSIKVALMPKFIQTGETQVIVKTMQYLVVQITKVNAFEAIADLGDPIVWATLEWGGVQKRSKSTKRP